MSHVIMRKSPDSIGWQDYRAANTGMVVYYASDPISEIAIRETPEEMESTVLPEPNYETGTYGFYGCSKTKIRGAFAKSKIRYLFFLTKYAGTKEGFKDKMLVTGYYKVAKTADVQKLHLRYLDEYSCIDSATCIALRADEVHFVALTDAFEVTVDQLKMWGFNAKVSKQLRIILNAENTAQLLTYLKSKPNQLETYIRETKRLSPYDKDEAVSEEEPEPVSADRDTTLEPLPGEIAPVAQETGALQDTVLLQEAAPEPEKVSLQDAVPQQDPAPPQEIPPQETDPQQEIAPEQESAPQ